MLDGSETWPVKKENEMALHRNGMTMIRWMCGIILTYRFAWSWESNYPQWGGRWVLAKVWLRSAAGE